MKYLNLTDTKIFSVLNSDTKPILTQFDKVFGNSTANMPNITFNDYEKLGNENHSRKVQR